MSATITSNLSSTTTTAYVWTGEANNSPSVKRVNGVEVARNFATRPLVEALSNVGNRVDQRASRAWSTSGGASVELDPDGRSTDSFLTVSAAGLVPGNRYTLSADIQVPASITALSRSRRIVVYNAV